jgi:hypothetical protein
VQEGRSTQDRQFGREEREGLMDEVFGGEVHAPRLAALTDGVDGVRHAASLGVRALGQGLAVAQGLAPRHAITPVDRWLSHPKLSMAQVFGCWVPCVVGERRESVVHVDGTACEDADQCTVVLGRPTEHGRRTPLVWKTVTRAERKEQRHDHADDRLVVWASVVPKPVRVTVVADRGVSDRKLDSCLTEEWGCDDIIRCRGVVSVEEAAGERSKAKAWLGTAGRRRRVPARSGHRAAPSRARRGRCPGQGHEGALGSGQPSARPPGRRDPGRLWTALHGRGDVQGGAEPSRWTGTPAGRHRTP